MEEKPMFRRNLQMLSLAVIIPLAMNGLLIAIGGAPNRPGLHSSKIYQWFLLILPISTGLLVTLRVSISPLGRAVLTITYIIGEATLLFNSLFWFGGIFFGLWP
jgi:hypothetical protein